MKKKNLSILNRIRSFKPAVAGLADILRTEPNAWIHGAVTIVVLLLASWLRLDPVRFGLIVLAIVNVWVAESFNTVSEVLTDHVSPDYSPTAKRAKDIGAAAVLITCIGAVILGILILGPPLCQRLGISL